MYRILLADDEGIVINSLSMIITKNFESQFEIETAKSGRMAIEVADRFRPDIIFMDIDLPGINGKDWGGREAVGGSPRGETVPESTLISLMEAVEGMIQAGAA